ncbi:MAG: ABC-F family ATP-binding cassette domain-containing protein, partial [Planctomycetota bacterium]
AAGGHTFEARLAEILGGLGFTKEDHDRPTSVLSGGQRCRAALAKLLLEDKPLLLLDEPTNHLDIDAVRWLEKFLTAHQGGAVVISHDRYLLDRLCQRIIEVERGQASSFPGNYTNYAQTKARRALTQERQFEKDQAFITKERAYIAKHLAGQRSQQAKGRRTRLNRQLADGELVTESVGKQQSAKISFQTRDTRGPSETEILRCDDLTVGFDGKPLFAGLSLQVRVGERFCVTGPNGTGKTTMLRVLMGELPPMTGTFSFSPRVRIGYYAQSPSDMEPARSIIDEIRSACTHLGEHQARSYLARFLFRGNDVFKPLGALSGGEQSRVRLATLILQRPDVLVLDEPTNHLDIPSREVLEEALHEFPGAIIAVSHDRYFLDQVAERLLVMRPEGHRVYEGNYSFYLRELEAAQEAASARPARRPSAPRSTKSATPKKGYDKNSAARKKKGPSPFDRLTVEKIEAIIIEKETKLAELQARFGDPAVCRDPEALEELQEEIDAVAAELTEADAAWRERID